ncbi:unnamed protein product [Nesidiocoris tenuis]|nr:unnamed protein product [Nesidiocoris tenuis]
MPTLRTEGQHGLHYPIPLNTYKANMLTSLTYPRDAIRRNYVNVRWPYARLEWRQMERNAKTVPVRMETTMEVKKSCEAVMYPGDSSRVLWATLTPRGTTRAVAAATTTSSQVDAMAATTFDNTGFADNPDYRPSIVVLMSLIECTKPLASREYCEKVQFDFRNQQQALDDFSACVERDDLRIDELQKRFIRGWAKYAAKAGAGSALRVLENPEMRDILLPGDEWDAVISKAVQGNPPDPEPVPKPRIFIVEIVMVIVATTLTALGAFWTLKLKSLVEQMTKCVSKELGRVTTLS